MLGDYLELGDDRVEVRYIESHAGFAEQTFHALDAALRRLSEYFCLRKPFPRVRAILAPDRSEFDRLVLNLLHVSIETPSNPGRIAQPQKTDMVFLSPPAYKQHSKYEYNPGMFRRLVFHELTHVFEEYLTPDMETIPRWWSEGLAAYLSGQWKHENDLGFREPVLQAMEKQAVPKLVQIEADTSLAYDFGWTMVKFIENAKGKETVSRIVKETTDGDVFRTLGEGVDNFQRKWKNWLLGSENGIKWA